MDPQILIGQLKRAQQFFNRSTSELQEKDSNVRPAEGMHTAAQQVAHDGAHYVVAQGTEAGGHTGRIGREGRRQDLQGDFAAQCIVAGAVNFAHATDTDLFDNGVVSQGLAGFHICSACSGSVQAWFVGTEYNHLIP